MSIQTAAAALEQNGFTVRLFETGALAADALCALLHGRTIGFGGSMTLEQLGLFARLSEENTVYWHWRQEPEEARRLALTAQVYLTSVNAVSETGELVNIDGSGNRVAASLYGHERVIVLAGVNKLAPTLEEAIRRARNIAAPLNARRLHRRTPCALSEPPRCHDCRSPERICCALSVQARPMMGMQTEVWLIGESLGY